MEFNPTYFGTSIRVIKGDNVRLTDVPVPLIAVVEDVIAPKSESARNLGIFESGGIIFRAESGEEFV